MRLQDQIADYLDECQLKRSPATVYQYRFVFDSVLLPWAKREGITDAAEISDKAMDKFTNALRTKPNHKGKTNSLMTVRSYVRSVRTFLTWASVSKGKYQMPRAPRRIMDVLTRQEIDLLEATAIDERDRLIVRVLADTGIRVGELLGLTAKSLRENTRTRQCSIRVIGKGDKEREVAIPGNTFRRLRNYAELNKTERIFTSKRQRSRGRERELTRSGVDQLFRNLGKTAGIAKRCYPHGLRHAYVTHMAIQDVPMEALRVQIGHSTLNLISTVYSHVRTSDTHDLLIKAVRAA